jgi:hypothetical protein
MVSRFVFDESFIEAFVSKPGGHWVLGKRLKPLSTWHVLQLQYLQSPLAAGGPVAWSDLWLAVRICGTSFPESVGRPRFSALRLSWARGWRRLSREVAAFEAYAGDYMSSPEIQSEQTSTQSVRLPDLDSLLQEVAMYRKMSGCAREEAWNVPVGELSWMNTAWARMNGAKFSIMTPIERAMVERMKAAKLTKGK